MGDLAGQEILRSFGKIMLAGFFMVPALYLALYTLAAFLNTNTTLGIFIQTAISALFGSAVYWFSTSRLKSPEIRIIQSSLIGQFKKQA
jgi:hypothetical protein